MALVAKTDRVFKIVPIDSTKPLSSTGLVDPRLFTGENKLHAIKDPQTCLWSMKYEQGILPPPLKGLFTGFGALKKHCVDYFEKRNMRIEEID
jgi:hypothetical protein